MWGRVRRILPDARLLWIVLSVLGGYGIWFLGTGEGILPLFAIPIAAVATDLLYDRVRFETVRFPDAAIATGLFIALLLPPTVPIFFGITAAIVAISVKHILRSQGRPWFNPATIGVLFVAVFGILPAWWGSINIELVLALGVALAVWNRRNWRLPVTFLAVYAALTILERVLSVGIAGGGIPPAPVLLLAAIDPAILFFGLLMVSEPRTAPADPYAQPMYALAVAVGAAFLPFLSPTLAPLLALALGNVIAVGLRAHRPMVGAAPARSPSSARTRVRTKAIASRARGGAQATLERWTLSRRATAAAVLAIFVVIAGTTVLPALVSPGLGSLPPGSSSPGTGGGATASCRADNPTIPSGTLSELHRLLGPSVILSYDSQTGTVVFYDPVNHVTVTEMDLYEDFGYAEFNGDDFAVAGCAP